jgi:hypothetical protein
MNSGPANQAGPLSKGGRKEAHSLSLSTIDDARDELLTQEPFSPIAGYPNTVLLYTRQDITRSGLANDDVLARALPGQREGQTEGGHHALCGTWQIVFRRFSGCSQGEMKKIWYNLLNDISLVYSTCPETTCHFYNPFTLGLPIEVQSYYWTST